MALTQSLIETELSKQTKPATGWPWRLLSVGFLVFGTVAAIYLGMIFGFKPYLNSQVKNVDSQLNKLTSSVSEDQQKQLLNFYSQLNNVGGLLSSRNQASKYLSFLESNTLKNIFFNTFNFSYSGKEPDLSLDGQAPTFEAIAQQIRVFKQAPEISSVILVNSKVNEQTTAKAASIVNFSLKLIFNK